MYNIVLKCLKWSPPQVRVRSMHDTGNKRATNECNVSIYFIYIHDQDIKLNYYKTFINNIPWNSVT